MSALTTPTKRVLTEDRYTANHTPRLPHENALSDDLRARLQNVGSRVRRTVNEGYATQRSLPPTPYPSPSKPSNLSSTSNASPIGIACSPSRPIFRSANDTLLDVFGSPERVSSAVSNLGGLHTPSPSPKKRGRAAREEALDDDSDEEGGLVLESPTKLRSGVLDGDESAAAIGNGMVIDEETTGTINAAGTPSPSPERPVRPLKKSAASRQAA